MKSSDGASVPRGPVGGVCNTSWVTDEHEREVAGWVARLVQREYNVVPGPSTDRDGIDGSGLTVDFTYDESEPPFAVEVTRLRDDFKRPPEAEAIVLTGTASHTSHVDPRPETIERDEGAIEMKRAGPPASRPTGHPDVAAPSLCVRRVRQDETGSAELPIPMSSPRESRLRLIER